MEYDPPPRGLVLLLALGALLAVLAFLAGLWATARMLA